MKISKNTFDIISFLSGIISILLAIIAILLSMYFKSESDKTNIDTRNILTEIKSDAKSMKEIVLPELKKYGDTARSIITPSYNLDNSKISDFSIGKTEKLQIVSGKSFSNTIVPLDNHKYISCTFDKCTFIFRGEGSVGLIDNTFGEFNMIFDGQAAFTFNFISKWYSVLDEKRRQDFSNSLLSTAELEQ